MSNLREVFLRNVVLVAVLSALAIPARAQSMQVYGKTGYLGEYELCSIVSEQVANGRKEYSGPLAVKHVGLRTRDGPQETTGQIRFHVTGSSSRATATLVFEGVECTWEGVLLESYHGCARISTAKPSSALHNDGLAGRPANIHRVR
jgi:hypothetical protein